MCVDEDVVCSLCMDARRGNDIGWDHRVPGCTGCRVAQGALCNSCVYLRGIPSLTYDLTARDLTFRFVTILIFDFDFVT